MDTDIYLFYKRIIKRTVFLSGIGFFCVNLVFFPLVMFYILYGKKIYDFKIIPEMTMNIYEG